LREGSQACFQTSLRASLRTFYRHDCRQARGQACEQTLWQVLGSQARIQARRLACRLTGTLWTSLRASCGHFLRGCPQAGLRSGQRADSLAGVQIRRHTFRLAGMHSFLADKLVDRLSGRFEGELAGTPVGRVG
jgi:hypothetical protein